MTREPDWSKYGDWLLQEQTLHPPRPLWLPMYSGYEPLRVDVGDAIPHAPLHIRYASFSRRLDKAIGLRE